MSLSTLSRRVRHVKSMRWKLMAAAAGVFCLCAGLASDKLVGRSNAAPAQPRDLDGQQVFRYDTFGDEQQWTDRLRMHEVIEAAVDPLTALQLGLKVDVDALPDEVLVAIATGQVDLTDPATTLALIELNAVVGIVGKVEHVDGKARLASVGITCALCHSTVDNSF